MRRQSINGGSQATDSRIDPGRPEQDNWGRAHAAQPAGLKNSGTVAGGYQGGSHRPPAQVSPFEMRLRAATARRALRQRTARNRVRLFAAALMLAGLAGVLAADNLIHPGIVKSIAGIVTGSTGSVAATSLLTTDKFDEGGQPPGIGVPASVISVTQAGQAAPHRVPVPDAPASAQAAVDTASEHRAISGSRQEILQETAAVMSGEADASSQRAERRREIIPSVKTQQELFRSFQSYLKSTGNAEITDHRTQEELFRKFIRWSVESPPGN